MKRGPHDKRHKRRPAGPELPNRHDSGAARGCAATGGLSAVALWVGFSYLLRTYFRHFGKFKTIYGTLGAAIALMIWFYWTGLAVLVGAQLNAELAKVSSKGKLKQKHEPLTSIPIDPTA